MKLSTKVNLIISITISCIIILIFFILAQRYNKLIKEDLLQTARYFYKNIVITRSWIAQYNGVYVEKKMNIKSNPYLKNPDIQTTDNRIFTKKNPALVTRELSELSEEMSGKLQFHITSLNPINPSNAPNEFERQALESFHNNNPQNLYLEYSRIEQIDNKNYFRYFGPLFTETSCLNCHSQHGYTVGDIRGGISILLPMDSIEKAKQNNYLFMIISGILTILILSFTINFLIRRVIIKPLQKIENATKALEQGIYAPLTINKNDEIGDLACSFQSMQQKIQIFTNELLQSEKKYRTLINCSPEAVLILNKENKIIDANENITRLSQYKPDDILNQPADMLFKPFSYKSSQNQQNRFETTLNRKDGTTNPIEVYISPEYYETDQESNLRLFYLCDLLERKRIEKIMVETEKMFALHQLSSGIAHEIRNPLFSVRNNLNYLKEKFNDKPEFANVYSEINTGLQRINTLINSIIDYARPHQPEFKRINIEQVINRSLNLIRKQFEAAKHTVAVDIPPDLPFVEIDHHKIEQVFINLSTNSLQAMTQTGLFEISIRPLKNQLKITISDNGKGIKEEDLPRIFDPFFTRSPNGTGLGLSIVKSIVQQHSGKIRVYSKHGQGTTFKILLPFRQK